MPIMIDELIVEAAPPRAPQPHADGGHGADAPTPKTGQAEQLLELSIVADRHRRLQAD
jgi:hypothetical protein